MIYINAIANFLIFGNVALFYIFIFGRENKAIAKLTWVETQAVRVGLILTSCGALLHFLHMEVPSWTQVGLNCGLGILFSWAAHFHYTYFVKKK
jgi:hypothetical protein